jgi:hypothetical protein
MKSKMESAVSNYSALPFVAAMILMCAGAARADYVSTVLADHPSAYYRFEELTGATSAADSSVNNNPANIFPNNESVYPQLGLPGIETNSFLFSGGTFSDFAWVDIPASALITPLQNDNVHGAPFSCELWVQPTGQPSTYSVPIENAQYPNGWNIYVSGADANGGTSYFYFNMPQVIFQGFPDFPIAFPSPWYHLVVTYDGANVKVYINGVSHGPYAVSYSPAIGSDAHVGSGQGVGWLPFIGGIDEVAFYTNVLSASQVTNHYMIGTNSFRAAFLPPSIAPSGEPASITNYSGLLSTFTVTPSGTLPFHYHWFKNGTPIGTDSSSVSFVGVYPADAGASIKVVVTNNYGSVTSSPAATLTLLTNNNIVASPGSITRNVGSHAAFHVIANGAIPINYQWSRSTDGGTTFVPLAGETHATLWLSNVQMAQDGYQYRAGVIGPFTSNSASPATLNVQVRAVNVPLTGYGAIIKVDDPVAYWRLDETNGSSTAVDAVGTFDGEYTPNAGTVTYGVAPGIPHDVDPAIGLANGATIQVPFAPELNPDMAWSVESWVQPASLSGVDYRVVLSSEYNLFPNPYNGWYIYQQPNNSFAFVPQPGNVFITAGSIVANNWYYLTVTDDGTNFNFYINGVLATAPFPVASANFIPNGTGINPDGSPALTAGLGNTVFGQRTDGAFNTFEGNMDDTAIYNYALSPQQIVNHFANTTHLTITRNGNKVIVSWPLGTLQSAPAPNGVYSNVIGATSPYTNSVGAAPLFYRVQLP